ncbi:hypothetical protein [Methanolapillus ohkumae]|uniref:hypothetical protein n=1 Tax=Methanolapillus ohkumae TaxID=3028298 RepID=UPI0030B8DC72
MAFLKKIFKIAATDAVLSIAEKFLRFASKFFKWRGDNLPSGFVSKIAFQLRLLQTDAVLSIAAIHFFFNAALFCQQIYL